MYLASKAILCRLCHPSLLPFLHVQWCWHWIGSTSIGQWFLTPHPPALPLQVKWCWHWIGSTSIGQWFLEVDRVLRPGGFFVFYANTIWGNHNVKDQVGP